MGIADKGIAFVVEIMQDSEWVSVYSGSDYEMAKQKAAIETAAGAEVLVSYYEYGDFISIVDFESETHVNL